MAKQKKVDQYTGPAKAEDMLPPNAGHLEIYTDGACKGNPGPGGWGVLIQYKELKWVLFGGETDTTSNRMELTAAIEAVKWLIHNPADVSAISLITDSVYVKNGITTWIHNWKKNGWKTVGGSPVKNADLWVKLNELTSDFDITWEWVKGHNGTPGNEEADLLANKGVQAVMRG